MEPLADKNLLGETILIAANTNTEPASVPIVLGNPEPPPKSSGVVKFDNIPSELKDVRQWVLWKDESGRKVPYQINGYKASSTKAGHWASFDEAHDVYARGGYTGVGFVFAENCPFAGVDLDNCRDAVTGKIEPWAQEIIDSFETYCEVSPSKTGVKLFVRGKPAATGKRGDVEVYFSKRYFTLTGDIVHGAVSAIAERQEQLDRLCAKTFDGKADSDKVVGVALANHSPTNLSLAEMLDGLEKVRSMEHAVSGQEGSRVSVAAVCEMIRLGFRGPDLVRAAEEYNGECCEPPWSSRELLRIVDSACQRELPAECEFDVVEEETNSKSPKPNREIVYRRITSKELATEDFKLEFAIADTLVLGQPLIVAGPQKVLKTSIMVDAAISLATGGYFLGHRKVNRPYRVVAMSGESGLATLQETAHRICKAAKVELAKLDNLIWSPDLPKFGNVGHATALEKFLRADGIEMLMIDPAYLCMPGADAGNLFTQGEMLHEIAYLCEQLGITLILAHHTKKMNDRGGNCQPLCLNDIAWAGFQEFARQWWLLNRREPYEEGTGEHHLWMSIGGSAGHSALWGVDVVEGVRSDFSERAWDVNVFHSGVVRDNDSNRKAEGVAASDRNAVVAALRNASGPLSKAKIREIAKIRSDARAKLAIEGMVENGGIATEKFKGGNGITYTGYTLAEGNEA